MAQYYEDHGGQQKLRPELLNQEAQQMAAKLVVKKNDGKIDDRRSISSAQLRRFYGEFKGLEKRATDMQSGEISERSFVSVLPLVKMVKSKVAYASNPSNPKVPQVFRDWLDEHVDSIQTAEDFKAFLLHFEAVVGFCYGLGLRNN